MKFTNITIHIGDGLYYDCGHIVYVHTEDLYEDCIKLMASNNYNYIAEHDRYFYHTNAEYFGYEGIMFLRNYGHI